MTNIQNTVFNAVKTFVTATQTSVDCVGEYTQTPEKLPCLMFYQLNTSHIPNKISTSGLDDVVDVSFEAQIYSNLKKGRKEECYAIADLVEQKMATLGFRMEFCQPLMNADPTIYRLTMRFGGRVSKGVTVGTNTKYIIFNK